MQLVYCIIIIYHCLIEVDFSTEKSRDSTGHRNLWYQQGNLFSEFDDGETLVRNPSFINRVL